MGRDYYGPKSFQIGTPEQKRSLSDPSHVNYVPKAKPAPPVPRTRLYTPQSFPSSNYLGSSRSGSDSTSTPTSTATRNSGYKLLYFVALLVVSFFVMALLVGPLGLHSEGEQGMLLAFIAICLALAWKLRKVMIIAAAVVAVIYFFSPH